MVREVDTLIKKIRPARFIGVKNRAPSANDCIADFLTHLLWLRDRHCPKPRSDEYRAASLFRKPARFHRPIELTNFFRCHLEVAVEEFQALVERMKRGADKVSAKALKTYGQAVLDYLHDIQPIAEHLERHKDPEYSFFRGQKRYHTASWEIFFATRVLTHSADAGSQSLDERSARLTAVFMLRQALELKFARLIAVGLYDKNFQSPRLKHGFHYDFIKANLSHYEFVDCNFHLLEKVYAWCNSAVHSAILPLAWQVPYAIRLSKGLFDRAKTRDGEIWSINGSVRIRDTEAMQASFTKHFIERYDHGIWCIEPGDPEALFEIDGKFVAQRSPRSI